MKNLSFLRIFISLGLLAGLTVGQVMMDFDNPDFGTHGWGYGWGSALTTVERVDDATFGGVLALNYSAAGGDGGAMAADPLDIGWTEDITGAAYYSFDVYLPGDFPAETLLKIWGQDTQNWNWVDYKFSPSNMEGGKAIVVGGWTTVWFDVHRAMEIYEYNDDFIPWALKGGIEIYFDVAWEGTVFLDNFTLWGVEPDVLTDFDDADLGTAGWGTGWGGVVVEQYDHPEAGGVMSMTYDNAGGSGDAMSMSPVDMGWTEDSEGYPFISYDVFVPAEFPTDATIKVWMQCMEGGWAWIDVKFNVEGVNGYAPLLVDDWNTLTFPTKWANQVNTSFLPSNVRGGIEVYFPTAWAGTLYVDNIRLHNEEVGTYWTMADFEDENGGTGGFLNTGWNYAMTDIYWAADPTGVSAGILATDWDFDLDPSRKAQFVNSNLDLLWTVDEVSGETIQGATATSFDVFVPEDLPYGTIISMWATDRVNWTWTEFAFQLIEPAARVDSTSLVRGQWCTITYDVLQAIETWAGEFDPVGNVRMGVQIQLPATAPNWVGTIPFDNFKAHGVEEPAGDLLAPPITVSALTSQNRVSWTDSEENLQEVYAVYASANPITDVHAEGVVCICPGVARGVSQWNHGLYSSLPEEVTYYYAVTAIALDGTETELLEDSVAGPITNTTREVAKAYYVPDFADSWVLDNTLGEFDAYADFEILPEPGSAYGPDSGGWDIYSTDLNFRVTFVVDDVYLYMGAQVWDDDPTGAGQSWMGDAIEFFMGFYDIYGIDVYHDLGDVGAAGTGDYRISFTSDGDTEASGSSPFDYPGLIYSTEQHSFGYDIEARFDLAVFGVEELGVPTLGAHMPLRIDANDMDPINGDEERTLQIHALGQSNDQNWLRPSSWGYLELYDESVLECDPNGDVNLDQALDILDVVITVGHVLGSDPVADDVICHGDMNTDGSVDILDIVMMVAEILAPRTDNATSVTIHEYNGNVSLEGNGYVGGIQMTLNHGSDFTLDLNDAYIAESHTVGNTTKIIVVEPGAELFNASGDFQIEEVLAASGNQYLNVELASTYALLSSYPNPFNPVTQVTYYLPHDGQVRIDVFNTLGQQVATLANEAQTRGEYRIEWNGTNDAGTGVPTGIYLLRLNYDNEVLTHKVTFMK